ncbi:hypothetical protein FFLO_06502 [Filobasidium floriforme]|uniref:Delta 8-(E)-sphingolipid desaturase n=1 Tax=Filobasidium floriforme TaxID=5210 RepID=A0A8K0NQE1_9TREE|nr:hypothetical protein FFLO_06502 [Filobasidium floriforme]
MIAEGHIIVVYEGQVLNLDGWMDKHPGGKLPLMHMIGVEAGSEINAYHSESTLKRMTAYRIGRVDGHWKNFLPPIRGGVFRKLAVHDCHDRACGTACTGASGDSENDSVQDSGYWSATDESEAEASSAQSEVQGADDAEAVGLRRRPGIDKGLAEYPSPDVETQRVVAEKFKALHKRVQDEGFYTCRYRNYAKEMVRYTLLFSLFIGFLRSGYYFTSAMFLGFFWQQIMFTAHDAGHRGITGKFIPDTLVGIFIADFCCGLSIGWWKSSHNVHHLVTNSPEHDPDTQNVPIFATCPSQFRDSHSSYYDFTYVWDKAGELMVPYQKYTYYPIMAVARFNLYILSWCHLLSRRSKPLGAAAWTRPAELVGMTCYWFVFGYLLVLKTLPDWYTRVGFVLISHMITMLLHVQITLSHWGMPTSDLGTDESFAQRQLRTTMDVLCPAWMDFVHGGLQFQAIHHLFPRVPRHNLRSLQPIVEEFCVETGVRYNIHGFVEGNACVLSKLKDISHQLHMLSKCQDHMAETGESGL